MAGPSPARYVEPLPAGCRSEWRRVASPGRPVLLVNPASGGGRAARAALAEHARARGIEVCVLEAADDLATLASAAAAGGADALGVAGGDGSLAIVAAAARTHDLPFVCIPAGTRNHFALDLGLDPHDLVGSLDAFTDGVERRIDVGTVAGRLFLNNVSLGLYGEAVRHATYRDAKLRTLLETAREVLGPGAAVPELHVVDDADRVHRRPAVVLVSNNPYALERPAVPGRRPRLDGGRLGVVVIERPGAGPASAHAWTTTALRIGAPAALHAGVDGEAVELDPPLELAILPGALRVRIPARQARQ